MVATLMHLYSRSEPSDNDQGARKLIAFAPTSKVTGNRPATHRPLNHDFFTKR